MAVIFPANISLDNSFNISFINTDGSLVVVALNESNNPIDYMLTVKGKTAKLNMPARSIQTIIL